MKPELLGTVGRRALWISPIAIVVVGFIAAIPWLKQQSDVVALAVASAAAIFVMGYAQWHTHRLQRHLDEVQIASQGFAISRGWNWGTMAAVVLLLVTPLANWGVDLANTLSTGSPETSDRGAVRVALFFGLALVVVIQFVGNIVALVIWWRRMDRP